MFYTQVKVPRYIIRSTAHQQYLNIKINKSPQHKRRFNWAHSRISLAWWQSSWCFCLSSLVWSQNHVGLSVWNVTILVLDGFSFGVSVFPINQNISLVTDAAEAIHKGPFPDMEPDGLNANDKCCCIFFIVAIIIIVMFFHYYCK